MTERIQIVDDDSMFRKWLRRILEREGYSVCCEAETGTEAVAQARKELPSLVLLDLVMPGMNGLEVCQQLKQDPMTAGVPIIMITGNDKEGQEISCLDMGADDYLVKPARSANILARCRALLRRTRPQARPDDAVLRLGSLELFFDRKLAVVGGEQFPHLTPKEFGLLYYLASVSPKPCDRETIYRQIWEMEPPSEGSLKTVEIHVRRIRLKLRWRPDRGLVRITGRGYCLQSP